MQVIFRIQIEQTLVQQFNSNKKKEEAPFDLNQLYIFEVRAYFTEDIPNKNINNQLRFLVRPVNLFLLSRMKTSFPKSYF